MTETKNLSDQVVKLVDQLRIQRQQKFDAMKELELEMYRTEQTLQAMQKEVTQAHYEIGRITTAIEILMEGES